MNSRQAFAKLRRLLGPNAAYRENAHAPSAEERERARDSIAGLRVARETAVKARDARRKAILQGDAEYLRLLADAIALDDELSAACAKARCYRLTVGLTKGLAGFNVFEVKAEADNWQDIIDQLEKGKE